MFEKLKKYISAREPGGFGLCILGLMIVFGGSIGIRATSGREVTWICLDEISSWVGWLMVWLGSDALFTDGKMTWLLSKRIIMPAIVAIMKVVLGEERLVSTANWCVKKCKREDIENGANGTKTRKNL